MTTDKRIELILAYALSWVGGLIIYFVEKKNRFLRFHAMQSIMIGVIATILSFVLWILTWIPVLGVLFSVVRWAVGIGYLVLIIVCIVKAWDGDMYRLPVVGDKAEQYSR